MNPTRVPRARIRTRLSPALALVTCAVVISGCSRTEEPAVVTLPENAPTTAVPPTLAPAPDPGGEEQPSTAPEVAWSAQIGGPGDDVLSGVTGSTALGVDGDGAPDDVVAVGATTGGIDKPTAGLRDVLVARVSSAGETRSTDVIGSTGSDAATSVAAIFPSSGDNPDATSIPIACGSTDGDLAGQPLGLSDGWCGPVATTLPDQGSGDDIARLFGFTITAFGAESAESINAVAAGGESGSVSGTSDVTIYLAGQTDGLYPGAGDSAGRGLGLGDALTFRTSPLTGTSWIRQFGTPAADAALGVCSVDGNAYFVGWTDGDLGGRSNGGRDAWISMIDAAGMQRWLIQFGYQANEEFRSVAAGGDPAQGTQQFVAVGTTDGNGPQRSNGGRDALVISFAPDGSTQWALQFGSQLDDDAVAVSIADQTIYVAGTTSSRTAPVDQPPTTAPPTTVPPTTVPPTTVPPTTVPPTTVPPTTGDSGSTPPTTAPSTTVPQGIDGYGDLDDSLGPGGGADGFLTAIDAATGSILWTTRFGSTGDEVVSSMSIIRSGLLVVAGSTSGSLGDNKSAGGVDGFIVAYQLPSSGGGAQSWV